MNETVAFQLNHRSIKALICRKASCIIVLCTGYKWLISFIFGDRIPGQRTPVPTWIGWRLNCRRLLKIYTSGNSGMFSFAGTCVGQATLTHNFISSTEDQWPWRGNRNQWKCGSLQGRKNTSFEFTGRKFFCVCSLTRTQPYTKDFCVQTN